MFGGGFNARALSRIAADATTHIRPKARRERSPAPPGPTCAATSRPRQNPSSRAIARAFFKELEIETRAKPPPRFRERSPYTPVHMCSALIHATSPRERFAAESKSSPRRPAHRDDRALRRTRPPRRASVLPLGRAGIRPAHSPVGRAGIRPAHSPVGLGADAKSSPTAVRLGGPQRGPSRSRPGASAGSSR